MEILRINRTNKSLSKYFYNHKNVPKVYVSDSASDDGNNMLQN